MGRVGDLKVGSYAIIDDEPSRIASIQKSKPGKHGSAKFRCIAISLFDGSKRSFVSPVVTNIQIPIVEKNTGQVVSVSISESEIGNDELEACIEVKVEKWTFPTLDEGGTIVVNYPFLMQLADEDD